MKFKLAWIGLMVLGLAQAAGAQTYPSKPVRIIVPFAAGGANDLSARAIQIPLGKALGGTVIVENIAGASTKIATEQLIKAEPDGHTLMLAGHLALMGYYYSGRRRKVLAQDDHPRRDRATSLGHARGEGRRAVQDLAGARRVREEEPGQAERRRTGSRGHDEHDRARDGEERRHRRHLHSVQGRRARAATALLGGHVEYRVAQPSEVYPNVKAGKTRALAVAGPHRMDEMPDVPTLRELGIAFDVPPFGFDFWGPANMPPALADRISKAIEQAVKDPAFVEASKVLVYKPEFTGPDKLKESIRNFEKNIGPKMAEMFPPPPKK